MTTHRALGRGLSALIPDTAPVLQTTSGATTDEQVVKIHVGHIRPNPYQPRLEFDQEKLQELTESIRERGIIQPILVRRSGDGYELIAGERRFRAAKALGWTEVPAIVRPTTNREALEMSLLENLQRDDLNPIDEAKAFERLTSEFGMTQESVAKATGKQRSSVANILRLLKLPDNIVKAIRAGTITMGHAKALLAIEDAGKQQSLFARMLAGDFSVRKTEGEAQRAIRTSARRGRKQADPELRALEERLQQALGTKVNILHAKKRGKILIEYYSHDDLQRLIERLTGRSH